MTKWICIALLCCTSASAQTRIACGRSQPYTDAAGNVWAADVLTTGTPFTTPHAINGTPDLPLYQSERYGQTLTYTFTGLANGTYTVSLLLSENYWWNTGQRVMSMAVQGQMVWPSIDIFSEAHGQFTPLTKSASATVSNGTLTLTLTTKIDNAKCDAIDIEPVAVAPSPSWSIGLTATYDDGTPLVGRINISQGAAGTVLTTLVDQPFDANGFAQVTLTPMQNAPLTFNFALLTSTGANIAQMTQTVDSVFLANLPTTLTPHVVIKKATGTLKDFSLH